MRLLQQRSQPELQFGLFQETFDAWPWPDQEADNANAN